MHVKWLNFGDLVTVLSIRIRIQLAILDPEIDQN